MSTSYTGVPGNVSLASATTITEPADGDTVNGSGADAPTGTLTDYIEAVRLQAAEAALCMWSPFDLPAISAFACPNVSGKLAPSIVVATSAAGAVLYSGGPGGPLNTTTQPSFGSALAGGGDANSNIVVVVGNLNTSNPMIVKSSDGQTFTSISNALTQNMQAVAWCSVQNVFVVAGSAGAAATINATGTTVTAVSGLGASALSFVVGGGPLALVGLASSTTYYSSPNGTTWTVRTLPAAAPSMFGNAKPITYFAKAGLYVFCSGAGNIYTSADGITWSSVRYAFGLVASLLSTANVVVAFGTPTGSATYPVIAISPDGINWKSQTVTALTTASRSISTNNLVPALAPNGSVVLVTSGSASYGFVTDPIPTP